MSYEDEVDEKPTIGCAPFIIGTIIVIFLCLAARSCGRDMSNPFNDNGYERSILD